MICKDLEGIIPPGGIGEGGVKSRELGTEIWDQLPTFADWFHCAPGEWNSMHEVAESNAFFSNFPDKSNLSDRCSPISATNLQQQIFRFGQE